jgi:hypothetical protein
LRAANFTCSSCSSAKLLNSLRAENLTCQYGKHINSCEQYLQRLFSRWRCSPAKLSDSLGAANLTCRSCSPLWFSC